MIRHLFPLVAGFVLAATAIAADEKPAEEGDKPPAEEKEEKKDDKKDDKTEEKEPPPKETKGAVTIGGTQITYIAKTGTMPVLKEDGVPRANVFFVYYAATNGDGKRLAEKNPGTRPITYCFNGGPGAAAV